MTRNPASFNDVTEFFSCINSCVNQRDPAACFGLIYDHLLFVFEALHCCSLQEPFQVIVCAETLLIMDMVGIMVTRAGCILFVIRLTCQTGADLEGEPVDDFTV